MADWLYLMTVHADFPDPLAEIAALAAVAETGDDDVLLLLADRAHPPMSSAEPGDGVLLCTRDRTGSSRSMRSLALWRGLTGEGRGPPAPRASAPAPGTLRSYHP